MQNALRSERAGARLRAGDAGYARLRAAEIAVEQAYTATAELAADLPRLRAEAQLSSVVGQDVVKDVASAIVLLSDAMDALVRSHGSMAALGGKIGYRVRGQGGVDKPDENPKPTGLALIVSDGRSAGDAS